MTFTLLLVILMLVSLLLLYSLVLVLVPPTSVYVPYTPLASSDKEILLLEDATLPAMFEIKRSSHSILLFRTHKKIGATTPSMLKRY